MPKKSFPMLRKGRTGRGLVPSRALYEIGTAGAYIALECDRCGRREFNLNLENQTCTPSGKSAAYAACYGKLVKQHLSRRAS